jgi:hypothetical protein
MLRDSAALCSDLDKLGNVATDELKQALYECGVINVSSSKTLSVCISALEEIAGNNAEQQPAGHVADGAYVRGLSRDYSGVLEKAVLAKVSRSVVEKESAVVSLKEMLGLNSKGDGKCNGKGGKGKKRKGAGDDESDSDIEIEENDKNKEAEFKCPITAMEFRKPMKNTICGHIVDADGLQMITRNKKLYCPYPGCSNDKKKNHSMAAWEGQWKEDEEVMYKAEAWRKKKQRQEERKKAKEDEESDEDEEVGEDVEVL